MEKKKKYLLIIGIFIILLSVVGLTYAYWTITLVQDGENVVYTDCLNIEFTDSNNITLNNAYPMTQDELETDFFPNAVPYHFKLENKCGNNIDLTINLETLNAEAPVLKDKYVNAILWEGNANEFYTLDKEILSDPYYDIVTNENQNKLIPEALKAYTLYEFSLYSNESKEFNLILFMDEDTPVSSEEDITNNAHWKSKVTINSQSNIETTGMLRKLNRTYVDEICMEDGGDLEECSSEIDGMWGYKEQITEITFENILDSSVHTGEGVLKFDESALKDYSVMSYLVPTGDTISIWDSESSTFLTKPTYKAYIQGDEKILANFDSSHLFEDFSNVESIKGMDYLDTSQAKDMHNMFAHMFALTDLNLGNQFNTRKVTNMSSMFNNLHSLSTLNLGSQFNTSKVTDMSYMFYYMPSLTELKLGDHFDTSQVTDMTLMFYGLKVTTLDLGNYFDTSQVTDMHNMFYYVSSLTSLNLGSLFNTSQVTDMSGMFSSMKSLTELDLGSQFNTSEVTDMSEMFSGMSQLTSLNLGNYFDTRNVGKDANSLDYSGFYRMFLNDMNLKSIQYGDKFVRMNDANVDGMFSGCPSELEKPKDDSWKDINWDEV